MKSTITEFGFFMIAAIILASFFMSVVPMFQDGGIIKNAILDYVSSLC